MKFNVRSLGLALLCSVMSVAGVRGADDIVDTAVKAGSFKTLAAALGAADLVDALKGKGPFTVFAPTDDAFAKLPAGTVETLLKPENKAKLAAILTYHVVPGTVMAADVVKVKGAKSLNGQRIDVVVDNGTVSVDNAKVIKTDIQCSNGVIHVIDSVILPSSDTIQTVATNAKMFGTLLAAVKAAGLVEVLNSEGPFTVFAPTDEAFAKLPKGTVESLLKPENKDKLISILKYHVVAGRVYSEDAVAAKRAATLEGSNIEISVGKDGAKINSSKLIKTDIDASNGVIHVIDAVLMPSFKVSDARRRLENAVAQGSHMFNAGHHGECANVYHAAMTELMTVGIEGATPCMMNQISTVVEHATNEHSMTQRAWILRRGIDTMYTQLSSRN
jgi:transforming growth factor-beta-induced protein